MTWNMWPMILLFGWTLAVSAPLAAAADLPEGFSLASSSVELRVFSVWMGGYGTRIIRSNGSGTLVSCLGPGLLTSCEDAKVTWLLETPISAKEHLGLLELMWDSRFLSLVPGRIPDNQGLFVLPDGSVGTIHFSKSHSTTETLTMTAGAMTHSVSWDLAHRPCSVEAAVAQLESRSETAARAAAEAKD